MDVGDRSIIAEIPNIDAGRETEPALWHLGYKFTVKSGRRGDADNPLLICRYRVVRRGTRNTAVAELYDFIRDAPEED